MSDHDSEGFNATVDLIKQVHRGGGVAIDTPQKMCKLETGGDLGKRKALPPNSDDSDDDEITGEAGQRKGGATDYGAAAPGKSRSARPGRFDEDANRARRGRADVDEDEDEDECRDEDDDPSFPPARNVGRQDRHADTGQFRPRGPRPMVAAARRGREAAKMIKALHQTGGRRLDWSEALDVEKLAKIEGSPRARVQTDLLQKINAAADAVRRGERISPSLLSAQISDAMSKLAR
jgi:hypothetical protein